MTAPVIIDLPGDPVPKERPKFARVGKGAGSFNIAYTPKKTRNFEDALRFVAAHQMIGRKLLTGPLVMTVHVWLKRPKSISVDARPFPHEGQHGDNDNYAKACGDALNGVVYADDKQVVDLHVFKRYCQSPRIIVEISQLEEASDEPVFQSVASDAERLCASEADA